MTHVPYRGMAAIVPDLLSGTAPTSMAVTGDIRQHVEAGTLRALAVTSARRSRFLPDVPTFAELGFDRVTGVDWYGLFAPARTPQPINEQLQQSVHAAMKAKPVAEFLELRAMANTFRYLNHQSRKIRGLVAAAARKLRQTSIMPRCRWIRSGKCIARQLIPDHDRPRTETASPGSR